MVETSFKMLGSGRTQGETTDKGDPSKETEGALKDGVYRNKIMIREK